MLALRHPLAESHARGAVDGESKGFMPVCASDKVFHLKMREITLLDCKDFPALASQI